MPLSIPPGITAEAVLRAASVLDAGTEVAFGTATGYEAVVGGRRYPPKALVGIAAEFSLGRRLSPAEFSGGEAPGQANWYLRRLGFDVVSIQNAEGEDWSDDEILAAVVVYFEMLTMRLRHEGFVKAALLRSLASRTHGRSVKSCEYKLQNISAVLLDLGLTRMDGFAPAANYQARLGVLVEEFLLTHADLHRELELALERVVESSATKSAPLRESIEEPPPNPLAPPNRRASMPRSVRVVEAAARDAQNRALGRAGEAFVVAMEKATLSHHGRADLAQQVRWVADLDGDGLGFDVRSFDLDGAEVWIEVKTTNRAKEAPFYVTANEVNVSKAHADRYCLYRLFTFGTQPHLFVIRGALGDALDLEPVAFRAQPRAASGNMKESA
ncbi:MAG: DUF3883 domain-containing protein [Phycisphaerales bacterium]